MKRVSSIRFTRGADVWYADMSDVVAELDDPDYSRTYSHVPTIWNAKASIADVRAFYVTRFPGYALLFEGEDF